MSWLAFIDESGDHGLVNIDPASPMFAITACVFREEEYLTHELSAMGRLKHRFWSHEGVIFHSYDIRKKQGHFSICQDPQVRTEFYEAVSEHFRNSTCTIISAVINKPLYRARYADPVHAYALAVQFVLERIFLMTGNGTKIVFESRGAKEDNEVRQWCARISRRNATGNRWTCDIHFAKKAWNVAGLQMADLACGPIIHYVLNPNTQRLDWLAVQPRIRAVGGRMQGYGLKTFP